MAEKAASALMTVELDKEEGPQIQVREIYNLTNLVIKEMWIH